MKFPIQFIVIFFILSVSLFGQENSYSVLQMKNDLAYIRKKLESKHPNLYIYHSKEEIDAFVDSLSGSLTTPLTELEFYKHITLISSKIKDGHTIILPSKSITNYHNRQSHFMPFHFTISEGKLYVDKVCTNDTTIPNGAEILSINDLPAKDIITQLTIRQIRDGYNTTYPLWILNNYFREYYSYHFGHPKYFNINYKINDKSHIATIKALPKDSIYHIQDTKYADRNSEPKKTEGITLDILKENKYVILTIKDFHNNVLRKVYHQNFKKTIHQYFALIHESGVKNLILDLRDNQGGDIPNGALLLSYLIDKPFTVVEAYYKTTRRGLKKSTGQSLGTLMPQKYVFTGKLYILINGGSFSNSGIVASCLKRNRKGIFLGEESGGNNKVLAGYIKNYVLPHTKIRVQIPTKQFLLEENTPLTGHGTLPDIRQEKTLDDVIHNEDNIMKFTTKLIMKNM